MKRRKRNFLLVFAFVFVALGIGLYYTLTLAQIGAAYKAKTLCSGVFIAQRDPRSILNTDLGADDLSILRHINTKVDYVSKQVTADFFGIIKRIAMYRPGLGCFLDNGLDGGLSSMEATVNPTASQVILETYDPRFDAVLDWAFSEPNPTRLRRTRAVVILHKGQIVAERYAQGFSKDIPLLG